MRDLDNGFGSTGMDRAWIKGSEAGVSISSSLRITGRITGADKGSGVWVGGLDSSKRHGEEAKYGFRGRLVRG